VQSKIAFSALEINRQRGHQGACAKGHVMAAPTNTLKIALTQPGGTTGLWLNLGSAVTAEIAGRAGYDWCLIDAEHAAYDLAAMQAQVIALAGTGAEAIVRVPVGADWILKQVLDLGVRSVMVPMVETADQARAMVRAVRYPPDGVRGLGASVARASGYGAMADYAQTANDQICLIVQVESRAALANLPDICAVEGVDVVFVGPADLAADMGYIVDLGHADVQRAVHDALDTIMASGKAAGIIAFDPDAAHAYRARGVRFLGVGSDAVLYAEAARALKARF
jgi:4-hydroxy-2-oxoheptanedioate aldolase